MLITNMRPFFYSFVGKLHAKCACLYTFLNTCMIGTLLISNVLEEGQLQKITGYPYFEFLEHSSFVSLFYLSK